MVKDFLFPHFSHTNHECLVRTADSCHCLQEYVIIFFVLKLAEEIHICEGKLKEISTMAVEQNNKCNPGKLLNLYIMINRHYICSYLFFSQER